MRRTPGGEPAAPAAEVEVVYATATEQCLVRLPHEPGLTAGEAVRRSGLLERCRDVGPNSLLLGIYGVAVTDARVLEPGDRVEMCRPLPADPRIRRREAAARGGVMIATKGPC